MPRMGNKKYTISLRVDDEFLEKLNKLFDKYDEHAGYVPFSIRNRTLFILVGINQY